MNMYLNRFVIQLSTNEEKELSGGSSVSMCEGGERKRNHRQTSEDLYTRRVEGEQVILDLKLEKR